MSKTYLPYEPDQQLLLPAALQEWLPEDHLAYFISDVVDQLDMSEVTARYERERRGGPPYHARMMVKRVAVWLLRRCGVLTAHRPASPRGQSPSGCCRRTTHRTSGPSPTFARIIKDALSGLFIQSTGVVPAGGAGEAGARVCWTCTKVKANASKHKAMSYGRMNSGEGSAVGGGGSGVVATGSGSG